ncbi:MAG TPA: AgmX/PglI C-terminal domain-containing protein [Polyangia bacterium]|nr:AgmX/PglI C-terminal domain-containing protein [Polyangia bacterium]
MQPADLRLAPPKAPPPAPFAADAATSDFDPAVAASAVSAPLRLAAPAVLVEASFRGVTLQSRLLRADEPRAFAIGNARGCDAPVNPAWLPEAETPATPRRHVLLEPAPGGFLLHLTAAMRPRLETAVQSLELRPDAGRAEAPLRLPPGGRLHLPCGEVAFDIHAAEPAAAVPRPFLASDWRVGARYLLLVALVVGFIMLIAHLVPSDPRALSLDTMDADGRLARALVVPLQITAPTIDRARDLARTASAGGGAAAARRPAGAAGDRTSHATDHRMAIAGHARPEDVRALAARIRDNSILAMLDGPRTSALAAVLDDGPAMGADAASVTGNLIAANPGAAFGAGGLSALGSGAGGGGQGEGTIGLATLGTIGNFGQGRGAGPGGYGHGAGPLHARRATVPDPIIGNASVRGTLDKEIIRRVVRRHLNEVKYCYQQSLARRPSLEGRLVTQFTIAPTGQVLAAVVQSSTLHEISVEACVVGAIKRWAFPAPERGGLAMVSYPFTFSPAGD